MSDFHSLNAGFEENQEADRSRKAARRTAALHLWLTSATAGLKWASGTNVATIVAASTVLGSDWGLGNFGQNARSS